MQEEINQLIHQLQELGVTTLAERCGSGNVWTMLVRTSVGNLFISVGDPELTRGFEVLSPEDALHRVVELVGGKSIWHSIGPGPRAPYVQSGPAEFYAD